MTNSPSNRQSSDFFSQLQLTKLVKCGFTFCLMGLVFTNLSCSPAPQGKEANKDAVSDSSSGTDSPASSSADILSWERSHIDASFHPKDGELILIYPFTVTGTEAVTIKSVTPDCDCLVVPLPQKTFQPGETGQLEVKFLAGTRTGKQERVIEVQLEGQKKAIKLTATIEVPEIIKAEPKALTWKVGEEAKSKQITLTLHEPMKITSSQSSSKHFQVELIELAANKTWTIKITPANTDKARMSMIMLRSDYPHRPWDRMVINVRVEP